MRRSARKAGRLGARKGWQRLARREGIDLTPGLAALGSGIDFRSLQDFGSLVSERVSAARG